MVINEMGNFSIGVSMTLMELKLFANILRFVGSACLRDDGFLNTTVEYLNSSFRQSNIKITAADLITYIRHMDDVIGEQADSVRRHGPLPEEPILAKSNSMVN